MRLALYPRLYPNKKNPRRFPDGAYGDHAGHPLARVIGNDLRDRYEERATIRQHDGHYSQEEAERLAWGEVAEIGYRQHGTRTSGDLCAGCGKALDGEADVLLLPHGERAHAAMDMPASMPTVGGGKQEAASRPEGPRHHDAARDRPRNGRLWR
jgi:hypothetical protein